MGLFNRSPAWVKNYPHQMDKATLTLLAKKSKGPFDKPREMNFALYHFTINENLKAAIDVINAQGWEISTQKAEDGSGKIMLTATKDQYIINEENYNNDVAFFQRIAKMYDADYDGWFASN
jgi:hypothetical protein